MALGVLRPTAKIFATAAKILKKNYIDKGLVTPELIMTKYTPSSPNGAWAKAVNQFMNEIRFTMIECWESKQKNENFVLEFAQPTTFRSFYH